MVAINVIDVGRLEGGKRTTPTVDRQRESGSEIGKAVAVGPAAYAAITLLFGIQKPVTALCVRSERALPSQSTNFTTRHSENC